MFDFKIYADVHYPEEDADLCKSYVSTLKEQKVPEREGQSNEDQDDNPTPPQNYKDVNIPFPPDSQQQDCS